MLVIFLRTDGQIEIRYCVDGAALATLMPIFPYVRVVTILANVPKTPEQFGYILSSLQQLTSSFGAQAQDLL